MKPLGYGTSGATLRTARSASNAVSEVGNKMGGERITMPLGHEFPDCRRCKQAVSWTLEEATKQ
jgi:hypothetical protein